MKKIIMSSVLSISLMFGASTISPPTSTQSITPPTDTKSVEAPKEKKKKKNSFSEKKEAMLEILNERIKCIQSAGDMSDLNACQEGKVKKKIQDSKKPQPEVKKETPKLTPQQLKEQKAQELKNKQLNRTSGTTTSGTTTSGTKSTTTPRKSVLDNY